VTSPKELHPWVLKIHEKDNVGTAIVEIPTGHKAKVLFDDRLESWVRAKEPIPMAHKIALRDIEKGAKVLKYGECIGQADADISTGCHVHVHNIVSRRGRKGVGG
jgi:altronate dehydratase